MMKKMRKALCLLVLIVTLFAFTGCKKNEEDVGYKPALDKEISGVITVAGHYDNNEALEVEFNRFNEFYPNVELKYTKLDNYNRVIATTLLGEEAPDIYFAMPWMMDSDDYSILFENAEDLSAEDLKIDLSCIRDGLLAKDKLGKISIVPIFTTTYGMLVNENIFEKENIKVPTTYSELVDACNKLKAAGYANPIMGYNKNSPMLYSLFFPHFCRSISGNEKAIEDLNALKPEAGEYMRSSLNLIVDFMSKGIVDLESCNEIADDYNSVIKRFFEGDVPMMMSSSNTVSGTKKREIQSEAFQANPFKYSFRLVPSTETGSYFLNTISIGFSVNKNSKNLSIVNEFMRFLVSTSELNAMAQNKRMVTPCKDMKLDEIYSALGENVDKIIYMYKLGLADAPDTQVRKAGAQVTNGTMTVDEAIAAFGTFK